jgi:hypothetical protein
VRRRTELEARRHALLARCEAQRVEIAWRLAQLSPRRWARSAAGLAGAPAGAGTRPARHPLAWLLALASIVLLKNPRYALSLLGRTRTALTWLTRAVQVLTLLGVVRRGVVRRAP